MDDCPPWVSQGDIFSSVPQFRLELTHGSVVGAPDLGPALLVTHSCQLDKRQRSGAAQIKKLQFLPLLDVAAEDQDRQAVLRRDDLNPPEALYLGPMPGAWEAYVLLSEMYTLPAALFAPVMQSFEGDERADQADPEHLVLQRHADRMGRVSQDRVRLLYDKMALFWMRMQFAPPEDTGAAPAG